jgi:hypothetical protein
VFGTWSWESFGSSFRLCTTEATPCHSTAGVIPSARGKTSAAIVEKLVGTHFVVFRLVLEVVWRCLEGVVCRVVFAVEVVLCRVRMKAVLEGTKE